MTRLCLLGPVTASTEGGGKLAIGGPMAKAALTVLALSANRACGDAELVAWLWGDNPPPGAANRLKTQIFRLRKALQAVAEPGPAIVSRPGGYELAVDADHLDVLEVEALIARARQAARLGQHDLASRLTRQALDCWRGVPLADLGDRPLVVASRRQLEELRLGVLEAPVEAELALGRHDLRLGELEAATAAYPLGERIWALRMTALYRAGRPADAHRAYLELSSYLDEHLGLIPGPQLTALDRSIALEEGSLDWQPDRLPSGTVTLFPPLRSVAVIADNLPRSRSQFIGRQDDLHELLGLLQRARAVSIVGPGGVGKTRLAVEAAARALPHFPDGGSFIELGPLAEGELVPDTIAGVLGVRELPGRPVLDAIGEHLTDRKALLVLDNCEHLLDAVTPTVGYLTKYCPQVAMLMTSRTALKAHGEAVWRLAPLRAPGPDGAADAATVKGFDAVELFCDRAALVSSGFALTGANARSVAAITGRLDGIPLALELAAARLVDLDLDQLEEGLANRFSLLSPGRRTAPPRQQTMWAAVDWSFRLLNNADRGLLASLAPFAGSFDIEAAAAVAGRPARQVRQHLDRLAQLSMLESLDGRFRFLETIRAYVTERMEELPTASETRGRHLTEFIRRAELAEPHLLAPDLDWLETLEHDADNLREALRWAMAARPVDALRLSAAMWRIWDFRGHYAEGVRWLDQALTRAGRQAGDETKARALLAIGLLTASTDEGRSHQHLSEAAALFRGLGRHGELARALCALSVLAGGRDNLDELNEMLVEANEAAQASEDPVVAGLILNRRSEVALKQGRYSEAVELLQSRHRFLDPGPDGAYRAGRRPASGGLQSADRGHQPGYPAARAAGPPLPERGRPGDCLRRFPALRPPPGVPCRDARAGGPTPLGCTGCEMGGRNGAPAAGRRRVRGGVHGRYERRRGSAPHRCLCPSRRDTATRWRVITTLLGYGPSVANTLGTGGSDRSDRLPYRLLQVVASHKRQAAH